MNERIKELVKQAEQYALDKANEGDDEDYDYAFDDDFQQKFAELIVKDCIDTVRSFRCKMDASNDNITEAIKGRFGVKE